MPRKRRSHSSFDGGSALEGRGDELASLAALLLDEHGHDNYAGAKRSAARRLGYSEAQAARLDNRKVAAALRERQAGPELEEVLRDLRREALQAMSLLRDFEPRAQEVLVEGPLLGEPGFELHLTADAPEQVVLFLDARKIPARLGNAPLRFAGGREADIPSLSFRAGEWRVRLLVFPPGAGLGAPLSEETGKPQRRLSAAQLQAVDGG